MIRRFAALLVLLASFVSVGLDRGWAQETVRIAAVVNDEPISALDVENRVRLTLLTLNQPYTPENVRLVGPSILRTLIDEKLQAQEARARGVGATDEELQAELDGIEKGNRLPPGGLRDLLRRNQIPISTLENQLRTQMVWQRTVGRRARVTTPVSEEDITDTLSRLRESIGKPEFLVAEIIFNIDETPESEADARRRAARVIEQLRGDGNFALLARQVSQGASATNGGDIGWVTQGQLEPALDQRLQSMRVGELTEDPVKTTGALHIMLLRDRRITGRPETSERAAEARAAPRRPPPRPAAAPAPVQPAPPTARIRLQQLVVPAAPNASQESLLQRARQFYTDARAATNCADLARLAPRIGAGQAIDLGQVRIRDLAPPIQPLAAVIPLNEASQPIRIPTGILILMVCERDAPVVAAAPPPSPEPEPEPEPPAPEPVARPDVGPDGLPSRDLVARRLLQERLDAQARRYLRDLRQTAFIDVRQ